MQKTLSLVIPCYNEAEAIPLVIGSVIEVRNNLLQNYGFSEVEVIVVDDGSTDQSFQILKNHSFIKVYQQSQNSGYGASLKKGFDLAMGQWLCFFDMDLTYPVEYIPKMWDIIESEKLDIVIGQRSLTADGMSLTRGFGNWFYSQLMKWLMQVNQADVCSGFRLFHRRCLDQFLKIDENSLGFSLEMSIRAHKLGYK